MREIYSFLQLASSNPFGHPLQVCMQFLVLQTCVDLWVCLARALDKDNKNIRFSSCTLFILSTLVPKFVRREVPNTIVALLIIFYLAAITTCTCRCHFRAQQLQNCYQVECFLGRLCFTLQQHPCTCRALQSQKQLQCKILSSVRYPSLLHS